MKHFQTATNVINTNKHFAHSHKNDHELSDLLKNYVYILKREELNRL